MCNVVQSNAGLCSLNLEQVSKISKNLKKIGAGVILISGGEPFLYKDIDKAIKILTSDGFDVRLQSNGFNTPEEKIKKCFEAGAKDFSVSLDTLNAEIQDYINSVPDSWDRAIKTIAVFSKYASKTSSICGLGTVLSKYNYKEIPNIIRFATAIGWYVSLVPVHTVSQGASGFNFRGRDSNFNFEKKDIKDLEAVIEQVKKMKKGGYNLFDSDSFLDSSLEFIKTGKVTWRRFNKGVCDSPHLYFIIRPDGSFAPCADHYLAEKIYLYDDDFPNIYRDKKFLCKVYNVTKNCGGCHYGSYPEMSLSVHDPKTILERYKTYKKARKQIIEPYSYEEMVDIINNIKSKFPTNN